MRAGKQDKMKKSIEPIKFVTEKFLYNKESNELELEFSIRNISQERVTITGIEVENPGIFRGRGEQLVFTRIDASYSRVDVIDVPQKLKDPGRLIFSKVFQKYQLNRYSLLNDSLSLPFVKVYDSYNLDPDESALFVIKIACVRTMEDIESKVEEITLLLDYQLEMVHVFSLIAYCRYSEVEDTTIKQCVRSDKIYTITIIGREVPVVAPKFELLKLTCPEVITLDLRLQPMAIVEYHSETIEEFLKRIITKYDLKEIIELFSFADIIKKLKKLNGGVIDEYLRELSKKGDTDLQNKISRILNPISNEPVLKEKGRWKKFFHNEG